MREPERVMRRLRELRSAGLSYEAVAAACGDEGLLTTGGRPWKATYLRRVLRTEEALGASAFGKWVVGVP